MSDKELLYEVAVQLHKWARESRHGGWSTHQVKPQVKLGQRIFAHLGEHPEAGR